MTTLIGKRAGKKIKPGDRLQVRNPDHILSEEFIFTGSRMRLKTACGATDVVR